MSLVTEKGKEQLCFLSDSDGPLSRIGSALSDVQRRNPFLKNSRIGNYATIKFIEFDTYVMWIKPLKRNKTPRKLGASKFTKWSA